jgi:tetratricopeptide (TPR) repeat protein
LSKIYISSTYDDLKACRESVYRALRRLGHDVVAMEEYVAAEERPLEKCLADVSSSDIYVGIFAWRYGYVPTSGNPNQQSITELELRAAASRRIPCLLFLLDEDSPWPVSQIERGSGADRIRRLRAELSERYTVSYFENCTTLAEQVSQAIALAIAPRPTTRTHVFTAHLPVTGRELFGREREISFLDSAWDRRDTRLVSIVGLGGSGKSALVNHWLSRLERDGFRGADRVYGWSFYGADSSADRFVEAALMWFGDPRPQAGSAWDKGTRLAALVGLKPSIVVLDGLDSLQFGRELAEGEISDPALQAFLRAHLSRNERSLCVLTTRIPIRNLGELAATQRIDLQTLSEEAAVQLLAAQGVTGSASELRRAFELSGGHALALTLLGGYLRDAHGGNVRRLDKIESLNRDVTESGLAHRVIASYEDRLGEGPELAVLRLVSLFSHAADKASIEAIRAAPAIKGLTESLQGLRERQWQQVIERLRQTSLLAPIDPSLPDTLGVHPFVGNYFREQLKQRAPAAWREAHARIYEHLKITSTEFPSTLEEMAPLYDAIAHGCEAGRYVDALHEVYRRRISRGASGYSKLQLGAFGSDLFALSHFFETPWTQTVPQLTDTDKSWLLAETALSLRALGRLAESVEPVQASLRTYLDRGDARNAALAYGNLTESYILTGELPGAIVAGQASVNLADTAGDTDIRSVCRTNLAYAHHQSGNREEAGKQFLEAETLQTQGQPTFPFLHSLEGFRYCDFLLDNGQYHDVASRATQAMEWDATAGVAVVALHHLSLGRAHTARAQQAGSADFVQALAHVTTAVDGLRQAARVDHLPLGLLARVELSLVTGEHDRANRDLDEAMLISERGGMRLYEVDAHLAYVRLYLSIDQPEKAQEHLTAARSQVDKLGYHRRSLEVSRLTSVYASLTPSTVESRSERLAAIHRVAEATDPSSLPTLLNLLTREHDRAVRDALVAAIRRVSKTDFDELIGTLLVTNGKVDASGLPHTSSAEREAALIKYKADWPDLDLAYSPVERQLTFRNQAALEDMRRHWQVATDSLERDQDSFYEAAEAIVSRLCHSFGLPTPVADRRFESQRRFCRFTLDASTVFRDVRINGSMPVLLFHGHELSQGDLDDLRDELGLALSRAGSVGFLVVFADGEDLLEARGALEKVRKVYAQDVFALDLADVVTLVGSKQPRKALRRFVLSRVNLVNVNPFTTMGPAQDQTFVGREKELREIADHVQKSSFALIGGRRIGKTSILQRLYRDRLPAAGFCALLHDCATTPTYEALLAATATQWQPHRPPEAPKQIGELFQALPLQKPIVFLFDEVDKLVLRDRQDGWPAFNAFRALVNAGRAQFVFGGERTLRKALLDGTAPLFNFASEIAIGRLDPRSVEELITLPMKQLEIEFSDEAAIVARIWKSTSGHPNIVQRLCSRLLEHLHTSNTRRITPDDVDAVLSDPGFVRNDFLATYFSRATVLEHLCALLMTDSTGLYTLSGIHGALGRHGVQPSLGEVDEALGRLVDLRDILARTAEGYRFAVPAIPAVVAGIRQLNDLVSLRREIYLREGDIEPELAADDLRGRLW